MLSHEERERLLREMYDDPAWRRGAILTTTAYMAVMLALAVLALAGVSPDLQREPSSAASSPEATTRHPERASIVEARRVFDERRARFDGQSTGPQTQTAR